MVRYIDAIKIIKDLQSEYHGMISDESLKIYKIIYRLNTEPTADVVEVKHGQWLDTDNFSFHKTPIYQCSVCKREVTDNYICLHKYCLHCGAKMDGGKAE